MHAVGQRHTDRVDGRVIEDTLKVGGGLGVSVAIGGPTSQLDIRIDDDREVDVDTLESAGHRYVAPSEGVGLTGRAGADQGNPDLLPS